MIDIGLLTIGEMLIAQIGVTLPLMSGNSIVEMFKPDFENGEGGWIVYYDHGCETLAVCDFDYYDAGEPVRYATREEVEKSIKENERDWKIFFGIKEEE